MDGILSDLIDKGKGGATYQAPGGKHLPRASHADTADYVNDTSSASSTFC